MRATFRTNLRPGPGLDPDKNVLLPLTRQLTSYVDNKPSGKQEKALPLSVFRAIMNTKFTPLDEAMSQLATGFFSVCGVMNT